MSVSIEKLIPGVLPPEEEQAGVDFVEILDEFDPSVLSEEALNVFAAQNQFVTSYGIEPRYYTYEGIVSAVPDDPAEVRLEIGRRSAERDREELIAQVDRYWSGLPDGYENCRRDLVKAIGSKTCVYIVEKEAECMSAEQRVQLKAEYERWVEYLRYERAGADRRPGL